MKQKITSEFDAFTKLTDRLLSVPHSEIKKRIEKHRREAAKNPHKRGPKPKATSSVSRVPRDET